MVAKKGKNSIKKIKAYTWKDDSSDWRPYLSSTQWRNFNFVDEPPEYHPMSLINLHQHYNIVLVVVLLNKFNFFLLSALF